ncbi:MAG: regulatory protein RecX [Neisseriales bacterium]|nr:MAG: regulatory protein RecX [Neisseriales bacterium]
MKTLRQRAFALLARREYSRSELIQRLSDKKTDRVVVLALLDELVSKGWQSDQRFADEYVRTHRHKYGKQHLVQVLKQHQITDTVLQQVDFGDERCYALALWRKKFGNLPRTATEKAKQIRFLITHGFSLSIASKIVNQKTLSEFEVE